MKNLLDGITETWNVLQTGPENEILHYYAEKSRIFTKQYACELFSINNNLIYIYVYVWKIHADVQNLLF